MGYASANTVLAESFPGSAGKKSSNNCWSCSSCDKRRRRRSPASFAPANPFPILPTVMNDPYLVNCRQFRQVHAPANFADGFPNRETLYFGSSSHPTNCSSFRKAGKIHRVNSLSSRQLYTFLVHHDWTAKTPTGWHSAAKMSGDPGLTITLAGVPTSARSFQRYLARRPGHLLLLQRWKSRTDYENQVRLPTGDLFRLFHL